MAEFSPAQRPALLPDFGGPGTGGMTCQSFVWGRSGYRPYPVILESRPAEAAERTAETSTTNLLNEVREGFGRTFSHLPAVFGVSRQTLYNWLAGDVPRPHHQPRLNQLLAAARVFRELGFVPTALSLGRTVELGQSFLERLAGGADGEPLARKLVRVERSGSFARARLDALVGHGTPSQVASPVKPEGPVD